MGRSKWATRALVSVAAWGAIGLLVGAASAEVWTADPLVPVRPDVKPAAGALVKLVAPRNGFASGEFVVRSATPLSSLAVEVAPFTGPGTLPKTAVNIRYPTLRRDLAGGSFDPGRSDWFDTLSDKLVPGEKTQPVWITVNVPAGTVSGQYRSQLTVQGQKIPLELAVSSFTMPEPKQRRMFSSLLESADSVALRYGVRPYSDQHFKLLEPSLALAGHIGGNVLYVPVIGHTYYGNQVGLIQFRQSGQSLTPDFTAFDKYVDLFVKHCGTPKVVILYLWDIHLASEKNRRAADLEITVLRGEAMEPLVVPKYPANEAVWKAVIDGAAQRLGKLGISRSMILIGQSADAHPDEETVAMFRKIAPDIRWAAWTHGYGYRGNRGANDNEVALFESPDFTPGEILRPVRSFDDKLIRLDSLRCYVTPSSTPLRWRFVADGSLGHHKQGLCIGYGKVGVDYWPLPNTNPRRKEPRSLWGGPFPGLRYCRLDRDQPSCLTVAGPAGALSTTRLEALAEGTQEAEARLAIQRAVHSKAIADARAAEVIRKRYAAFTTGKGALDRLPPEAGPDAQWSENLLAIYNLAGEAQQKIAPAEQAP